MIDHSNIKRIITHANCPDGMASAMICHDALPDADVEFVQYGEPERENLEVTDGMLFVDMTPPEARVQEFVDAGAWVLDHHKGAKDLVARFGDRGVFADEVEQPGIAGANLAYQYVWLPANGYQTLERTRRFAELAGIRDTWQKDSPLWNSACVQAAVLMFWSWDYWTGTGPGLSVDALAVGHRLIERRNEAVERAAEKAYRFIIDPGFAGDDNGAPSVRCAIFSDPEKLTSDVAERLRADGVHLTAGFFFPSPGVMVVSLRSDGSVDVSELAKRYGGGGHSRAAGFRRELTQNDEQPFALVERLIRL